MPISRGTVQLMVKSSRYVSFLGLVLTFIFNGVLILLTNWYIKRKFGTYKPLIIIFSVIGIGFDSLEFIVWPMIQSVPNGFLYFSNVESTILPREILTHLLCIYGGLYHASTSFIAVMFIHRYFSVAKPEQLFYFQEKRITLWISYSFFIGISNYLSIMYFGDMDEYSKQYMSHDIFQYYGKFTGDLPAKAIVIYGEDRSIRWNNVYAIMSSSVLALLPNMIIVYCGYKIRSKLYSKNSNYSQSLRKLHSQFFKTLVLQVAIPTVVLFVPIIVIMHLPMIGVQIEFPTGIVFGLFALYPAIDSCIVMYIITEYETAMRDCMRDICKFIGYK